MHALNLGNFKITPVRAGSYWWDGGTMFGVVPKTLWSKHETSDELNRIEAGFNCFVVETEAHRILIETGGGVRHDERARERMRLPDPPRLAEVLARHGFDPESIDVVVNTHLHWDHCGGNTVGEGSHGGEVFPALPRARYVTQRGELDHAREQLPRIESGHMHLLDGDGEVAPGVELRVTPGHTRDMMIVLVRSRGETWCHLADLVAYAAQLTPTWVTSFDLFPLETIANKTQLLGHAAAEDWWCSFGHDPRVNFAKIEMAEGKWRIRQKASSAPASAY
jgi:glyoxylase-like metal-dependent hydrolase (beta-lactamase superfamily II)